MNKLDYQLDSDSRDRWHAIVGNQLKQRYGSYMGAARRITSRADRAKNLSDYLSRFARGDRTGLVYVLDNDTLRSRVESLLELPYGTLMEMLESFQSRDA